MSTTPIQMTVRIPQKVHTEAKIRAILLHLKLGEYIRILIEEDLRKPVGKSLAAIESEW